MIFNPSINQQDISPSQSAGLKPGDMIVQFNGQDVETWDQLVSIIEINPGQEVSIKYLRGNSVYLTSAILETRNINGSQIGYIGVSPVIQKKDVLLIFSYSGNSEELNDMLNFANRFGVYRVKRREF